VRQGRPEIFNTDQGSQFTDAGFTGVLRGHGVAISLDGRGRQYLRTPFYGSRRMTAWLQSQGHGVNRKRVQRLMQRMGLAGHLPAPDWYAGG
jgi:transposase InsO family protein